MIKSLCLRGLLKKTTVISFHDDFHTYRVLSARFRKRNTPRAFDEPGESGRGTLEGNSDYPHDVAEEHEFNNEVDMSKIGRALDEDIRKQRKFQRKVSMKIAAQKFFSPKVQPSMLTYNERLCIQYLHQQDPVQWDLKTLSESFPATTDVIKKIIKSKRKITPEIAKKMDAKVLKNWELLEKGELDADLHVLEHLKKFINRREILLEQIKNEDFYLPEIKVKPVWNQGEMTGIINSYEKDLKRLVQKDSPKALTDGEGENKSNLEVIYDQIKEESRNLPENKDSFMFGEMINTFKKHVTLENLENEILKKAESNKKLDLEEKVILENKMGIKRQSFRNIPESSDPSVIPEKEREQNIQKTRSWRTEKEEYDRYDRAFENSAGMHEKPREQNTQKTRGWRTEKEEYDRYDRMFENSTGMDEKPREHNTQKMRSWRTEREEYDRYDRAFENSAEMHEKPREHNTQKTRSRRTEREEYDRYDRAFENSAEMHEKPREHNTQKTRSRRTEREEYDRYDRAFENSAEMHEKPREHNTQKTRGWRTEREEYDRYDRAFENSSEMHEKPREQNSPKTRSWRAEKEEYDRYDRMFENNTVHGYNSTEELEEDLHVRPSLSDNIHFGSETDVGKILHKMQKISQPKENQPKPKNENIKYEESTPGENSFYDKEVLHIQDTAFWNNKKNSSEKQMAELEKRDIDGPEENENFEIPKVFLLNPDPYPERIKVPKGKRGSGLTFRIKDCYYDDDGEFLYRVIGMKT